MSTSALNLATASAESLAAAPALGLWVKVVGLELWAMGNGLELWVMGYGLWAMGYGLWAMGDK